MSKNSIDNLDAYNLTYNYSIDDIFSKYILLINEYINHFIENIYTEDKKYFEYILQKGINTINHVFKILLLYTKNIDTVYHNCQKSYIYYIEFIGQIGQESHSFLQLNSNDAMLFVYKKTIFDIPNKIISNYSSNSLDENIDLNIEFLIKIHNTIILNYINNDIDNNINNILPIINNDLKNVFVKILKYNNKFNEKNTNLKPLEIIFTFITYINEDNMIDFLNLFIKKLYKKNNITINKLKEILLEINYKDINNSTKYINQIFSML